MFIQIKCFEVCLAQNRQHLHCVLHYFYCKSNKLANYNFPIVSMIFLLLYNVSCEHYERELALLDLIKFTNNPCADHVCISYFFRLDF